MYKQQPQYFKDRREHQKSMGICPYCREPTSYGKIHCPKCRQSASEYSRAYRKVEGIKEHYKEYARARRKLFKELGLCTQCGETAFSTFTLCQDHLQTSRERRQTYVKTGKSAKRQRERRKTDIQYKLGKVLRSRLSDSLRRSGIAGHSVRDLGCLVDELTVHLENQFLPGMTWENHGNTLDSWSIDHIKPISSFDLTDREQFLKASHFTNLRPMWHVENLRKGSTPLSAPNGEQLRVTQHGCEPMIQGGLD